MCGDDLTPEQLGALVDTLSRYARYLSGLVERMNKLAWPKDDLLYARTLYARDAVMSLLATVHDAKRRARRGQPVRDAVGDRH
jgi:hypothetical protein